MSLLRVRAGKGVHAIVPFFDLRSAARSAARSATRSAANRMSISSSVWRQNYGTILPVTSTTCNSVGLCMSSTGTGTDSTRTLSDHNTTLRRRRNLNLSLNRNWRFHLDVTTSTRTSMGIIQRPLSDPLRMVGMGTVQVSIPVRYMNVYTQRNDEGPDDDDENEDRDGDGNQERKPWIERFNDFIAYKEANGGDVLVPFDYPPNPMLGQWVSRMRVQYKFFHQVGKQSRLNEHKISLLEQNGFLWDAHDGKWKNSYEQLKDYKAKYGTTFIPTTTTEEYQGLMRWIKTQRYQYVKKQQGEPSHLTDERIALLNDIDFKWDMLEELWNIRFEELKEYKRYHGDCHVPRTHSNQQLATWVKAQRTAYRKKEYTQLTPKRKKMLESVGFVWDMLEFKWNKKCDKLKKFYMKNGHSIIPGRDKSLQNWVKRMRREHKNFMEGEKSVLNKDRAERLRQAGIQFYKQR